MKVRLLTVSSTLVNNDDIPQIRLQGKWLEKLGFYTGRKFIVEESRGELIIRLITIDNQEFID